MNRGFRGGGASDETVAVLQAAIQQLAQRDQPPEPTSVEDKARPEVPRFIPADYFQGQKQGYYFGTSDEGTGYVDAYPGKIYYSKSPRWACPFDVQLHALVGTSVSLQGLPIWQHTPTRTSNSSHAPS
jgi:hypothetical protein